MRSMLNPRPPPTARSPAWGTRTWTPRARPESRPTSIEPSRCSITSGMPARWRPSRRSRSATQTAPSSTGAPRRPTTIHSGIRRPDRTSRRRGHSCKRVCARRGNLRARGCISPRLPPSTRKSGRDQAYVDAMATAYAAYPDDETKLFYGLALLATVKEGSKGFERQGLAAKVFEEVYAKNPHHPGVLHYLIHVYDDPGHATDGLKAARAYAAAAPAVPHAQHMPSHIFTRLGYWAESATTNENAWRTSEADVKRAGESGAYRDFHALNYLQYAYLQLGRFGDAKRVTGIIEAQYGALSNKTTAPDTPDLQARHVRGRTIYALPDRVVYGYFDMLTRFMVESGDWKAVATVPLVARSRDFRAMKLQLEAMAAAKRGDPATAKTAADELERLANEPGQHPLAQTIITLQAKEAQAVAAHAAGDEPRVIAMMTNAVEIENSIEALSQPPYP